MKFIVKLWNGKTHIDLVPLISIIVCIKIHSKVTVLNNPSLWNSWNNCNLFKHFRLSIHFLPLMKLKNGNTMLKSFNVKNVENSAKISKIWTITSNFTNIIWMTQFKNFVKVAKKNFHKGYFSDTWNMFTMFQNQLLIF